jgi:hypothetical protein
VSAQVFWLFRGKMSQQKNLGGAAIVLATD